MIIDSPELICGEQGETYGRSIAVRLVAALERTGKWTTRKELNDMGIPPRLCRLGRQYSGGQVICGQQGYRLTSQATLEEIHEAATSMKRQAATLMDEVQELWRVINKRQQPR